MLGIDRTEDKKIIKKAYATLIKKYKQDENPEKFKQIQQAYKLALSRQKNQYQQAFEITEEAEITQENFEPLAVKHANENDIIKTDLVNQQDQDLLIDNIYQQLHTMAFAPMALKGRLKNWKFIEDYCKIDDLALKAELARGIFAKVAEYNLFQTKQNGTLLINSLVLKYFDEIFDWSSQWNEYQHYFPDQYFKVTLDAFNEIKPQSWFREFVSLTLRFVGLLIDIFMTMIYTFIIIEVFVKDYDKPSIIAVISFMAYLLLSEILSKTCATLGKKYTKLAILDQFGNYCNLKSILMRQLIFNLSMLPIYLLLIGTAIDVSLLLMYFVGIIGLNFITFMLKRKLLHDFFSKTVVVSI